MNLKKIQGKKAAIEMSVSTVVVIVIAMSMLVLGLVLVRNIFKGAIYNVDQVNAKVEGEISKLFSEDDARKVVFYLPNDEAEIKQGETFGIAFGIKNNAQGESQASSFQYNVKAAEVESGCSGLTLAQADSYISLGKTDTFNLNPGQTFSKVVKIRIPEGAPLCSMYYDFDVTKNNQPYEAASFIVSITG